MTQNVVSGSPSTRAMAIFLLSIVILVEESPPASAGDWTNAQADEFLAHAGVLVPASEATNDVASRALSEASEQNSILLQGEGETWGVVHRAECDSLHKWLTYEKRTCVNYMYNRSILSRIAVG